MTLRRVVPVALVGLAVLLAALIAVGAAWPALVPDAAPSEPPAAVPPALTVRLTAAAPEHWPETLPAVGSIAAWQEVVIGAEIGGLRLSRLLVEAGDRVTKGQLLARIATGTLEAELNASRAALREAEIAAAEAGRAAERARALQRREALATRAFEQAVAEADMAEARLGAARARVEADRLRLGFTEVHAPDDGVISAVAAVEGALVHAGQEILRLQRRGRLEWRAELPGPDLARLAPGRSVRLALDGHRAVDGRVRRVSPGVDPLTRSGIVHVDLEPSGLLRAGLFARGDILLDAREVLTLPDTAVLLRDGFSHVFLIEDGRARQRKVTAGARRGGRVEIRAGLDAGTPVVESGVGFLSDGLPVRVVPAGSGASAPATR
ncbi:efflux RND transporter periplasmic adaptor subunit [Azospirillum halopraeferens]|uniref:efflux RND transporter periplasmic adaptor subunit n=1 Tax=Azospirillum halopraeferens TaxID=34010 RepID=UPI0003FBD682|nr:efflux RND transporter periplasmic adaptor subunit [Azospirillum halopraeferens]